MVRLFVGLSAHTHILVTSGSWIMVKKSGVGIIRLYYTS